jgi:hypothetical protein
MTYYVKMLGSTDMPMPNDAWGPRGDVETHVRFPPKPKPDDVSNGDEFVYYAVGGYKRVFATARVEGRPALQSHPVTAVEKRWPYLAPVTIRPTTKLKYVESGPTLDEISPGLQAKVRHGVSHFEIGRSEFERAVKLLEQAKREEDRKLRMGWTP